MALFDLEQKINSSHCVFPKQCYWLKLNGLWPYIDKKYIKSYNTMSYIFFISISATVLFQLAFLIGNINDLMKLTENCCTTFMGIQVVFRIVYLILNQKKFKKILNNFILNIWFEEYEKNITIKRRCEQEMLIFKGMSIMMFMLISMYCIVPLFELFTNLSNGNSMMEKPFPYKMIFPFNAQKPFNYVVTYIITSYSGFIVITTLFAEDSLFGFFLIYTCGQYKILHHKIERITAHGYENAVRKYENHQIITEDLIQDEYNRILNEVSENQAKLFTFCKDLDNFFGPMLLINFLTSSILICVVGFQIVTGNMSIGNYVKLILYILCALTQLFTLCWIGNKIIEESSKTSWKLYSCNWEGGLLSLDNLDENNLIRSYPIGGYVFNKKISFMIMRSHKPAIITAFKFSILSLESFTAIISTSMSYFTLLQSFLETE